MRQEDVVVLGTMLLDLDLIPVGRLCRPITFTAIIRLNSDCQLAFCDRRKEVHRGGLLDLLGQLARGRIGVGTWVVESDHTRTRAGSAVLAVDIEFFRKV